MYYRENAVSNLKSIDRSDLTVSLLKIMKKNEERTKYKIIVTIVLERRVKSCFTSKMLTRVHEEKGGVLPLGRVLMNQACSNHTCNELI